MDGKGVDRGDEEGIEAIKKGDYHMKLKTLKLEPEIYERLTVVKYTYLDDGIKNKVYTRRATLNLAVKFLLDFFEEYVDKIKHPEVKEDE